MVSKKIICQVFFTFVGMVNSQDGISTDETLTKYWLWSKENPQTRQELIFDNFESVDSSNFNASKPTKVLVHGFGDDGTTSWVIRNKNEFLDHGKEKNMFRIAVMH